jgi:hypothetical protein
MIRDIPIEWDISKPKGRCSSIDGHRPEQKSYGFKCSTNLKDGIKETIDWFVGNNRELYKKRNNYFTKGDNMIIENTSLTRCKIDSPGTGLKIIEELIWNCMIPRTLKEVNFKKSFCSR